LPEFWVGLKEPDGEANKERWGKQSRKVTDICTRVQIFGTYVAILSPAEPSVVPELMAYMGAIVRAPQDYEGLGWARYELVFRGKRHCWATGVGQ